VIRFQVVVLAEFEEARKTLEDSGLRPVDVFTGVEPQPEDWTEVEVTSDDTE
jgi:hypothetical protein